MKLKVISPKGFSQGSTMTSSLTTLYKQKGVVMMMLTVVADLKKKKK